MAGFDRTAEFSVAGEHADAGAFAWSPDGHRIAVLATLLRHATVYDAADGRQVARLDDLAGGGTTIDFDAKGNVLTPPQHTPGAAFMLWDPDSGRATPVAGPVGGSDVLFNMLFAFALDRTRSQLVGIHTLKPGRDAAFGLIVYDARSWAKLGLISQSVTALALSPDGSRLALIARGQIDIVKMPDGRPLLHIDANKNDVQQLAWSADGRRLATGAMAQGYGRDPTTGAFGPRVDRDVLQLWDATTGTRLASAPIDVGGGVDSMTFSADGRWLATTTSDGICRMWDPQSLRPLAVVAEGLNPTTAIARFSPDSRRLAILRTGDAKIDIYHVP